MKVGDKVKYSQNWLSSTLIKRAKWRGVISALHQDKDVPDSSFIYVHWEGDTEQRLVNKHNLTVIKDKDTVKKPTVKTDTVIPDLKTLSISGIAKLIMKDWGVVNYAAKPYLQAMNELKTVNDKYGYDSGASIVRYFLSNAASYRGDLARAVKKELRLRLEKGV
jgi:hypothetical protein